MTRNPGSEKDPVLRRYQFPVHGDLVWALRRYRGETFTVLFPRQAGKNQLAAELLQTMMRLAAQEGGSGIAAAPTFSPQGLIALDRTRAAFQRSDRLVIPGATRVEGSTITSHAAKVHFLSASREAHVAGHTASIVLMADEVQEVDEDWFERQFRPMAASTAANTIFFGTPWDGRTLLDQAVARNRPRSGGPNGWDDFHFEASWGEVGESRALYRDFVVKERERLGPQSIYFRTQYGLETVESAGSFLTAEIIAALQGTHDRQSAPRPHERYVASLDVGGDGARADSSVLTIARVAGGGRCEVVDHHAWQGIPLATLESAVVEVCRGWRLERLVVDATGIGAGVAEHLALALRPLEVEAFRFTPTSKSRLGFDLVHAASNGSLTLYRDDGNTMLLALRRELRDCTRRNEPGGEMRWGSNGGDDYVVSLALVLHAATAAGEPRFATGRRRQ